MRVVQVLTQVTGRPTDHVVDVAQAMAERGHDVHVVGPRPARADEAVAAGVTWHGVHMTHKTDVRGAAALVSRLRSLDADVLHGQDRRAGWMVRGLGRTTRARCIYTLHGVPDGLSDLVRGNVRAAPRRRRDALYYLHAERVATRWSGGRMVVPSEAVAAYAVEHVRVPAERVHVVHNGVDQDRWSLPPRMRSLDAELVVAWVGVLGPVKRLDLLLEAVARVEGIRLVVAGDGELREDVRRQVVDLGLDRRVELLGTVTDVRSVLARADLFALSSAAENMPLSLLQAMSCRLPVLATAVGGVPELVRDGVDGWLVPAGDVEATVAALVDAAARRGDLVSMGERARSRVLDGWTLDDCVDGLLDVYAAP